MKNLTLGRSAHRVVGTGAIAAMAHSSARADSIAPGISEFACKIIDWMQGELAGLIFAVVVVVTLVVGFFAKMDWTKILGVIVLYALLQGLLTVFSGFLVTPLGCLAAG